MSDDDEHLPGPPAPRDRSTRPMVRDPAAEVTAPADLADDAAEQRPALTAGDLVDHFSVIRQVGRGGMGTVYLARDTRLGRKVALKLVDPGRLGPVSAIDQFMHEARTTARFSHPHIVTVYEVGEVDGWPYLALEFLPGQTLRERLAGGRAGPREALRHALAIAEALVEAHRHGVTHRDLKPDNVMIPRDGRLRVTDFGLAKVLPVLATDSISVDLAPGALFPPADQWRVCGTPAYMAPEQWEGQDLSPAADIWALGVILHELLGGQRPYADCEQERAELFEAVTSVESVRLCVAVDSGGLGMRALVERCLDKSPVRRPTAVEVRDALLRAVSPSIRSSSERPFCGLEALAEGDPCLGRDREIEAFLERLRSEPVLPVVGPSGAGKSSLIQAGVIPRLREQTPWTVLAFKPGDRPFQNLASRLLEPGESPGDDPLADAPQQRLADTLGSTLLDPLEGVVGDVSPAQPGVEEGETARDLARRLRGAPQQLNLMLQQLAERRRSRVLLFVDQLEEVYSLLDDPAERRAFVEAIGWAADDAEAPVRVVFTLRDDYIGRLAEGSRAADVLGNVTVVRSPGPAALREILVQPVEAMGYRYEDDRMVAEMIAEVGGEPAALPLLQAAGSHLWEHRDTRDHLLLRSAYESLGGVAGALAEHAEGVLDGWTPGRVALARSILLRLVTPEGTRQVLAEEALLDGLPEAASAVLSLLVGARLVSVRRGRVDDSPRLELVHESLIRHWDRLARWMEQEREELAFVAQAEQAAALWERRGRRVEETWQGEALDEARRMIRTASTGIGEPVRAFLAASEARVLRIRRRRRAVYLAAVLGLLALAVVSLLTTVTLAEKERVARRDRALSEQREAEAQCEAARAAFQRGDPLEARAKLRVSLQMRDSTPSRVLWWQLRADPQVWIHHAATDLYDADFSPDGETIALAGQDGAVYRISPTTGMIESVLRGHEDQVLELSFARRSGHLATRDWPGTVKVWDPDGEVVWSLDAGESNSMALGPDGRYLAVGDAQGDVRVWDRTAGGDPVVLGGGEGACHGLDFGPDGRLLAGTSMDGTVRVWHRDGTEPAAVLRGHVRPVAAVAFDPSGTRLATCGVDRAVRLWDLETGRELASLAGHTSTVLELDWSADGLQVVSVGSDRTVRVWNADEPDESPRVLSGHQDSVYGVGFAPDAPLVVSAGLDGSARLWDLRSVQSDVRDQGHTDMVSSVAFSPDGASVASSSNDGSVRLWDVASGRERVVLAGHAKAVFDVAYSPDGAWVASAGGDGTVRLWDARTGATAGILVGHEGRLTAVAFHPVDGVLVSGGWDGTVRSWDVGAAKPLAVLDAQAVRIADLAFEPGGRHLAVAARDEVRWLSWPDGLEVRRFEGLQTGVWGLTVSPDGQQVAASTEGYEVVVWDTSSGRVVATRSFDGRPYGLQFHPDGARLGVALADGTARIWTLEDDSEVVLRGHDDEVAALRFDPSGRMVATAADDRTVRLWDLSDGAPIWMTAGLLPAGPWLATHEGWVSPLSASSPPDAEWARTVAAEARVVDAAEDGDTLCVLGREARLEIWSTSDDRLERWRAMDAPSAVEALPGACAVLDRDRVLLVRQQGTDEILVGAGARSLSLDQGELVVFGADARHHFSTDGSAGRIEPLDLGATAVMTLPAGTLVGFDNGNLEIALDDGDRLAFEETSAQAVSRLLEGPRGTAIVGFSDGLVGLWDARTGQRLAAILLHGSVEHLHLAEGRLIAATSLGDHAVLDLRVLDQPWCALLEQVWQTVPVVWEAGRAEARGRPDGHECAAWETTDMGDAAP